MNIILIAVIGLFFASMLAIGFAASKKQKTAEDFFVGGRSFGLLTSTATQIATGFGGGIMLAQVGIGYRWGFSALIYSSVAIPIGIFILAKFFARWLRGQEFYTTTDWMCFQYGESKTLRTLTSIVVALYAVAAWVAQPVAAGKILNIVTGLPVEAGIVIAALVVVIYTLSGGIMAVAYTDVAQLGLMIVAVVVLLPLVISEAGGLGEVFSSVPSENLTLNGVGNDVLLAWFLALLPAQIVKQTYHQRIYGAKTEGIAVQGLYNMAIASILIGFWAALLGMSIYSINPNLADQEQAMIWVVQHVLHGGVSIVVIAAIIAAIVSSADSALHSASGCLTRDIYQMVIKPGASDKEIMAVSKICIAIVGIAGVVIGIAAPNVLQALLLGYSMTAAGLFFPLILGHYWKGATRLGAIAGIAGGVLSTLVFKLVGTPFDYMPAVFWGLLASMVATIAMSKLGVTTDVAPE